MSSNQAMHRRGHFGRGLLSAVLSVFLSFAALGAQAAPGAASWPMFGQNAQNNANQQAESTLSTASVSQLSVKWSFTTAGDVSARPAVVGGVVYFPDWGGYLNALDSATGRVVWKVNLTTYGLTGGSTGTFHSRTTPAVVGDTLYVATQEGAWLLALKAKTGALVWKSQLETAKNDPYAIISTSPTVVAGVIYTGVASTEEGIAGSHLSYACCKARGSVVAVRASTGKIKWQTYTVPKGYSGVGVWGSGPVVFDKVYVGTGNNYSVPKNAAASSVAGMNYGECIAAGGTAAACTSPDDHEDSVLALNIETGAIEWSRKMVEWNAPGVANGSDNWNVGCLVPPFTNCPASAGPDFDFGSMPQLISYRSGATLKTILGIGQKSGLYYALDTATGSLLWQTQVGPGSSFGGMEWGSATDGKRIYVSLGNFYGMTTPIGTHAGLWAALDPATGAILWQTADPNNAIDIGPMTVSNGVVYGSSMSGATTSDPTMFAMDASSGTILWRFAAGSSVNAGAAIVDGVVYWGSGYGHIGIPGFTSNNQFYAFSLNGN